MPGLPQPVLLAVDLGTSSVRTLCFDRDGAAIPGSEVQTFYAMDVTPDGGVEIAAERLFDLLVDCIDRAMGRLDPAAQAVVGVGVTSFWHSLLGLDAAGRPATPLLSWADSRSAADAAALRATHDVAALFRRTGCRLHSSYWPAKLRWLARTRPETFARVAHWTSFTEYAALRLAPEAGLRVSISMASGTGLLDVHRIDWDPEALAIAGIDRASLSTLVDADAGVPLGADYARRWPALARAPWFPACGDGACANVGSGAIGPARIALTLGTSGAMRLALPAPAGAAWRVPTDLWAYRLDRERAVLGGALSNGGNLLAWLRQTLAVAADSAEMAAAAALPPDAHCLTLLPFVAGDRSPSWHDQANGIIAGLSLATTPADLLRAAMEAVAYRFARIYEALRPLATEPHQIVANGGAILNSPAWLQITADVLGHDLIALPPQDEATARGAALLAAVGAGVLPALDAAPDPAAGCPIYTPDPSRTERYRLGRLRQERLEALLFPADGDSARHSAKA